MSEYVLPALFALFVWWFSTGAIIYLDGLSRPTFRWSMLAATALLIIAFYGLATSSADPTVTGAYVAFTCGLLVWGWHEIGFLMGFVTGPRRESCPEGSNGWRRVGYAIQTILYHELAIVVTAAAVVAVTWGGTNQIGTWTYMILWIMRLSAKLNVFLGVPNLAEGFLPEHLDYLKSYFSRRPMNLLFPVSISAATAVATLLVAEAFTVGVSGFEAVGLTLLATLLALAILEHWFLVLPLSDTALWRWALEARERGRSTAGHSGHDEVARARRDAGRRLGHVLSGGQCRLPHALIAAAPDLAPSALRRRP